MEKWFVINKGADFEKLGKEFGISPVTARLIRNREVIGEAAFERYLKKPGERRLYSTGMWTDADGSALLKDKFIRKNRQQVLHGKMVCNQQRG